MSSLWLGGAGLTLAALLFVCWPFFRRFHHAANPNANVERVKIYKQRLAELNDEQQQGKLAQGQYQSAVIELKRRLLNELAPEKNLTVRGDNRLFALTGCAFVLCASALFYYFTGNHHQLSQWQQAMTDLPSLGERAISNQGEPLSANERQALMLGLRTRLAEQGDDAVAWLMLGRLAMSLNDFEMATQAFDKSLAVNPNNASVKLSYAQALLLIGNENAMNRAAVLLSQVLKEQPTNIDAISMLALIAYERKDWQEAKSAFSLILSTLDESDPRYAMIRQRISEINTKLTPTTQPPSSTEQSVSVAVKLDPKLQQQLPENGVLFVFAKAAKGPPMPLAVVRKNSFTLPLSVTLSKQNAMVEGLNITSFSPVEIFARISKDGNVATQAGELQGQSPAIDITNTPAVTITINQVIE